MATVAGTFIRPFKFRFFLSIYRLVGRKAGTSSLMERSTEQETFFEGGSESKLYQSTRENPNFVHDYFKSSRLHFIGSFRARYESLIAAIAAERGCHPNELLQPRSKCVPGGEDASHRDMVSAERCVIHIDMDCFFVSVAVAKNPSLAGRPLVVCHSGGGEISSASYEARKQGIRAGMMYKTALKLCPNLEILPYDFAQYEKVTLQIYSIFFDFATTVEAVSVDEAFLDVTGEDVPEDTWASFADMQGLSAMTPPERIAHVMRRRIALETGCAASAGIAPNKLLARLATKRAKPDGQVLLTNDEAREFLTELSVQDLPGVGWSTAQKLTALGVETCTELQKKSMKELQNLLGEKHGEMLYRTCRGVDDRPVEPMMVRKSLGAEASWGVRFLSSEQEKVDAFVRDLAREVADRLKEARAVGRRLNLKAMRRKKGAGLPYKSLGHGPCDVFNRSIRLESTKSLEEASLELLRGLKVRVFP